MYPDYFTCVYQAWQKISHGKPCHVCATFFAVPQIRLILFFEDRDKRPHAILVSTHLPLYAISYTAQRGECDTECIAQPRMTPTHIDDAIICQRQGTIRLSTHNLKRRYEQSESAFFTPWLVFHSGCHRTIYSDS